ncbi:homoserine O-acetyltransferase MetX [Thalassoglobus polymorphus]|uniref:Homoserine O-acetyltransferase n=1 Tax=Thalassoglobus polymorphus TaxID=2527994 RepID=A0A517QTA2_9PLAN|nr:homoserine O-acetyltransferase [Thalassoglobus polymorphus]QDT34871.1 Homoserine O-acetyltransferase [Thalassoglobus polymorphus]
MSTDFAETDSSSSSPDGFVERQSATLFAPPSPLVLESGETLGPITVAYQTYGTLSPRKDNVIYICHALTGDAHVAGRHNEKERKPGWWNGFIGPGKAIDTNRYFVVCSNILGGCQGTTGPSSENPQTGKPYGPDFPFITIRDIVNVHNALLDHLGIENVLAVVGGSLGGMQVLEWVVNRPERVGAAIVLASGPKLNAQGIAFNAVGRRAIYSDPLFQDGWYYGEEEKPHFGLALARMVAHITYLSEQSIELKFGRKLQNGDEFGFDLKSETEFQIESYLHYQGNRFVERFDANSYLTLTRAMDYFDLGEAYGSIADAFSRVQSRFLVISYDTDWLYPTPQSKEIVRALVDAKRHVTFKELKSAYGHDAFLIDQELPKLGSLVSPFLARTYSDRQ